MHRFSMWQSFSKWLLAELEFGAEIRLPYSYYIIRTNRESDFQANLSLC